MSRRTKVAKLLPENEKAFNGVDVYTGAEKLGVQDLMKQQRPDSIAKTQGTARYWFEANHLVESGVGLRTMYFDYGRQVRARNPKDAKKLAAWLENEKNAETLHRFVTDVWNEWSIEDSVCGFWIEGQFPWTIRPEETLYSNKFGSELLTVSTPGIDAKQLAGSFLSEQQIKDYTSGGELKFRNRENDESQFRVLTRAERYYGYGMPRMRRIFAALGQMESMEVGEHQYAYGGRMVIRKTLIGFEVRNAAGALKQSEYLWKKVRADAILKHRRGRQGFHEETGQFDEQTKYLWIDPKNFDARKWETCFNRIRWFMGPAGFLINAPQLPPHIPGMMEVEAGANRKLVGNYLERVLNESGAIGVEVRLTWSDKCFKDPRLFWQMAQGLLQAGALSPQTGLEEAGFDPEVEAARKKEAAKHPEQWLPLYDPNHGPGNKGGGNQPGPGKPPGTRDGDGKEANVKS